MSQPFFNEEFLFTQPDGTTLKVRGTGDQHHAIFETLDGFTVTQDPVSGFYHYAQLDQFGELAPMGVRPGALDPHLFGLRTSVRPQAHGAFPKGILTSGLPRTPSRWEVRRSERRAALRASTVGEGLAPAPPARQTVGNYVGLCLLIQFPDVPATISRDEVEAFCNKKNYSGFGNNGSVKDYFEDISNGNLIYNNIVAPYYTTKYPRSYYTNENVAQPVRAIEMIKEALLHHQSSGFDFTGLTTDNRDFVYAINIFYAGKVVNNWAKGLWPHAHHLDKGLRLAPNIMAYDYQITDMTNELSLGTFCHENGHMVCDFPDLYDYGYESNGIGKFCLMCAGGNADKKNPVHVNAYLKNAAGWSSSTKTMKPGEIFTLHAERNEFAIFRKNVSEYFIVENRQRIGRDAALPDEGLAIWHVDELGSNSNEQMSPSSHYECALMQADGSNDLETRDNDGDDKDLFQLGENERFALDSRPNSNWWDKSPSSLELRQIGAAGPIISFTVGSANEIS